MTVEQFCLLIYVGRVVAGRAHGGPPRMAVVTTDCQQGAFVIAGFAFGVAAAVVKALSDETAGPATYFGCL